MGWPSLVFLMYLVEPLVYNIQWDLTQWILFHFILLTTYILDGMTPNLYMTEVRHRESSDRALIWDCLLLCPNLSRKVVLPLSKPVVRNLNFLKMKIRISMWLVLHKINLHFQRLDWRHHLSSVLPKMISSMKYVCKYIWYTYKSIQVALKILKSLSIKKCLN